MLAILPLILSIAPEIARWIGGNNAGNVTAAVTSAVKSVAGTEDPDAAAAAITADPAKAAEVRVQLAKIAADAETAQRQADLEVLKAQLAADTAERQSELDALKASIADIGSARSQTLDLAKAGSPIAWGTPILSGVILVSFAIMLWLVLWGHKVEDGNLPIANVLLGTLAAMATQVANYWLGSSSGSHRKDTLIENAQTKLAQSVPAHLLPHPSAVLPVSGRSAGSSSITDALNDASLAHARAG